MLSRNHEDHHSLWYLANTLHGWKSFGQKIKAVNHIDSKNNHLFFVTKALRILPHHGVFFKFHSTHPRFMNDLLSSVIEQIYKIPIALYPLFLISGLIILWLIIRKQTAELTAFLVLGSGLVGLSVSIISNIAYLLKWIGVISLLILSFFNFRPKFLLGNFLFITYVLIGFIFLFNSIEFSWQFQRFVLLFLVAITIPLSLNSSKSQEIEKVLFYISLVSFFYSIINLINLPLLIYGARYKGIFSGAATFASALGAFLPFQLWSLFVAKNKLTQIILFLGFIIGSILLMLSGQRAGTITGILGITPLVLHYFRTKKITSKIIQLFLMFLIVVFVINIVSQERVEFLTQRYSPSSGLSEREILWNLAWIKISANPWIGSGIGAAESIVSYSFHNTYLEIWFNTGIFGLTFFLSSQIVFLISCIKFHRFSSDKKDKEISLLFIGFIIGFIFICIFESVGAGASNPNIILFLIIGSISQIKIFYRISSNTKRNLLEKNLF